MNFSNFGILGALLWGIAFLEMSGLVVNTNTTSVKVANLMRSSVLKMNESLARLSSGSRIMNPADDAAGLAVATKFTSQTHRIDAVRNTLANTQSFVQTADGYLQRVSTALSRMGEIGALAQDSTKSSSDLAAYNYEFQELKKLVRDTQDRQMNGQNLFAGESLAVVHDSKGRTFSYDTTDLKAFNYSNAVDGEIYSPPPFTWETTKDVWTVSKDGYMLREDAYKITQAYWTMEPNLTIFYLNANAWYKTGTGWSATDNGGTKYNSGSFIKEGAVAGHPNIQHDIISQLGFAAADSYSDSTFLSKSNPVSTGNGNIEAGDVISNAKDTFTTVDPSLVNSAIVPTNSFYQKGSFTTINPSPLLSTTLLTGGVVAVNPIASGEDSAATFYAAGSEITTDPTNYDVDPNAVETSKSHVLTASGAYWAIQKVKTALNQLSTDRASLGSVMGRLGGTSEELGVLRENLDQAVSRIRDTNVAQEATRFAKHKILTESATNMLKQANILPQNALRLILAL